MKATRHKQLIYVISTSLLLVSLLFNFSPSLARDTDIYNVNAKQNAYVLMDSSGSMAFAVYEHTVNYAAMYDYLFSKNDKNIGLPTEVFEDYIYDFENGAALYKNHLEKDRIYLVKINAGVTFTAVNGKNVTFHGDASNTNLELTQVIDTHTLLATNGTLTQDSDGVVNQRITIDNGNIAFDNASLPIGQEIKAHDFVTLYDGSVIDNGFIGLLNAPGFYFSGYTSTAAAPDTLVDAQSGDSEIFFFATGNWINMQAIMNLRYNNAAKNYPLAWPTEAFPIPVSSWPKISHSLRYPDSGNYLNNLEENDTIRTIVKPGATAMMVHFSSFDVEGDNPTNLSKFTKDYLKIYDQTGAVIATYDNDNKPNGPTKDGWSPVIIGNTATFKLHSDTSTTGTGYKIDEVRVVYFNVAGSGSYLMQSRLDVGKDAMVYVVDEFRGKMNWGFASFAQSVDKTTNDVDGANVAPLLNPVDTDDANRTAIVNKIDLVKPMGGTPLMEALQDVWEKGYYKNSNIAKKLSCRKNYIISMTDGFPSVDDDNDRLADFPAFTDADEDKWTQDPSQGLGDKPDYYDDVAHFMYTTSWITGQTVTDPANSYENVITHHIAFGAKHPLLEEAAGDSGGEYIVAYNKEQLIAAFYSLALMMSESVSFTAPVVSVDAVNKIQSGEDLYMGLFFPQQNQSWAGNVKKFKIGDGSSTDRPKQFMIYDANNKEAIDSSGQFLDNTAGYWGDDNDANDIDNYGAADIKEDGAGEVLLEDVQGFFTAASYWNRKIYTWDSATQTMVKFHRDNISAATLNVVDNPTRDKLINFTHGYTYDATAGTGEPLAVRDWILGSIIHSRPVILDYFDTTKSQLPLIKRFIAVGSNDGMLHVFDDETGREVLAFIPEDILPKLQYVQTNDLYDTVDGLLTLYRRDNNPQYLIFGERRGGGYYWSLDISDIDPAKWTVAWKYTNAELDQSWSEVKVASIPVGITTNGKKSFKDVAIFTGGYDQEEDYYPEPFDDLDKNGTPFLANGNIDTNEWKSNNPDQDKNLDGKYNKYNPGLDPNDPGMNKNEKGRGIFVVDIDDPGAVSTVTLSDGSTTQQILPFSVTYGAAATPTGHAQTLPQMKFSFPAGPSIATGTDKYIYKEGSGLTVGPQPNVLLAIYAVDIYANLYKAQLDFSVKDFSADPKILDWRIVSADWQVASIFNGNPSSTSTQAGRTGAVMANDTGRKAFYPPAISWGGSQGYFEAGNYYFENVQFSTNDKMASLFFGTGDRENPKYSMIRNRFYAIYDDSSVSAILDPKGLATNVPVASAPYSELNLMNLTCDELGKDSVIKDCYLSDLGVACDPADGTSADVDMKKYLRSLLRDDAVYGGTPALEYGASHENDMKGWYIVLADQGQTCGHMSYPTAIDDTDGSDHDNHDGEQILSQALLYYGTLYFTSYQPSIGDDECNPRGNGFSYALNYLDGSATYDLTDTTSNFYDITDRYKKFTDITGIPSGFTIITSGGQAAAMASMGGAIIGPGPNPNNPYIINTPGLGLELFYWRDSRSE